MSDANSDIALDEERNRRYAVYVSALKDYIREPTDKKLQKTVEAAKHLDSLKGWGYFTSPTSESIGLESWLEKLTAGDESVWVSLINGREGQPDYEEFKSLSPIHNRHKNN